LTAHERGPNAAKTDARLAAHVEKRNDKQLSAGNKLESWLIRFGVDAHSKNQWSSYRVDPIEYI